MRRPCRAVMIALATVGAISVLGEVAHAQRTDPAQASPAPILPGPNLKDVLETLGPEAATWYQHVQTLASPYFEGRANGGAGIERARDYAEFHFRRVGLEPAFTAADTGAPTFRQPFDFEGPRRHEVTVQDAHASIDGAPLVEDEDFVVLGNASSGTARGPVTFVGYAIARGPDGYSSFEPEADLTGHVALMLRYEPVTDDGYSRWATQREAGRFSPEASLQRKLRSLVHRGVAGIAMVVPPGVQGALPDFEEVEGSASFGPEIGVPAIQVSAAVAARLLARAGHGDRTLEDWRRAADVGAVRTARLGDATLRLGAAIERATGHERVPAANLGGVLRGVSAPGAPGEIADLAEEWVVIAAHYDHNGYGHFGTDPSDGPLFPGADDNASGTAGVLMLARRLDARYRELGARPRRSLLFLLFDAEERGLHGSRHWTDHPSVDPERVVACLNMDMIGRVRYERITVLGTASGREFGAMLGRLDARSPLHIAAVAAGSGASDDANFHRIGIPALHFFSGMHAEYTTPHDQAWTVNPAGAAHVLDIVESMAMELATRAEGITPGTMIRSR